MRIKLLHLVTYKPTVELQIGWGFKISMFVAMAIQNENQTLHNVISKLHLGLSIACLFLIIGLIACHSETPAEEPSLFSIEFDEASDLAYWSPEVEGPLSQVSIIDGALDIEASGGATIWFKQKLKAPIEIKYTAFVVGDEGPNDRVSDLNCFWMAKDPRCPEDIFSCADSIRTGKFPDYHQIQTYYVGYGGHNNSKTRFRRYTGTGDRPLLPQHDLAEPHLITPNKDIKVHIKVYPDRTTYSINDELIFDYEDEAPYQEGWFAFRTVRNHLKIRDFSINTLKD